MADAVVPAPGKRKWLKVLGLIFGILLVLIIILYFVATSSGFIKGVILPKVGKSFGAEVTASDVSLSPFKQIVLRDLKVQAPGREPVFTSKEVRVQYRLMDILKGNYIVDLISVESPVIALVERPDRTSNLDPIMEAMGEEEEEEKAEPMTLDLKKLVIADGTVRYEKQPSAEGSYSSEITRLNVNLDGLKTGGIGKLTLDAVMGMRSEAPSPGTNGSLAGTIKGTMDIGLTPMLMPSVVKGSTRMDITAARGAYATATGMAVVFDADLTATDIKQLALRLQKDQNTLGEIAASGPFSMEKIEGVLDVRLVNVERNALNFFANGTGMDFGKTAIGSTNRIQISGGGQSIAVAGAFTISNFQVTRTNQTTPVLNLHAGYDVAVDQTKSNAVLRALTLNGSQAGKEFLNGALTAPMVVNWGDPGQAVGDSTFAMNITGFNLSDWKAFLGDSVQSGVINSKLEVLSKQAGKQILFTHHTAIDRLGLAMGESIVENVMIALSGSGEAMNMEQFSSKYNFEMKQADSQAFEASGSGAFNSKTEEARGEIKGSAQMPALIRIAAIPDASFASGAAQFNLSLQQKGKTQQVLGNFDLQNLTGRMGSNSFRNFAAASKLDIAMDEQKAEIRKADINLSQEGKPGGTVDVTGTYWLSNGVASVKMALKDLNQNILGTFLQPALGDKALASISVNGQSSVQYDPESTSTVSADLKMSNFVVKDPEGKIPAKPLEAGLAILTTMTKKGAEIQKGMLTLTPTERAKNQLNLAGQFDMSDTNFTSGNLKITADSLDLTTYYDLFQDQGTTTADAGAKPGTPQPSGTTQPQGGQPTPESEPEPMVLPLTNFLVEAVIGRLYLSELEITNFVANTRINGGRVEVNPFQMAINGAPLRSTINLDLSVPGYRYDVLFGMTNVPFAPLVNTFTPERKGQVGGSISVSTQIKGAGTTGSSLQKNLSGYFDVATTNLNLSISELRSPMFKTIINVIAIVPSILKNPNSAVGSLTGALFGSGATPSGGNQPGGAWGDELMKSPIDVIEANAEMGSGQVKIQRAFVQSPAFQAQAQGTVQLAKILTNSSVNIPLGISIRRSLAESVNLVPPGTPTNAGYVTLPDYVAMKGTIGEPKTEINKKALLGTALQQYGGNIPGVDQKTGSLIQGLGGILSGKKATNAAPAATGTNAATAQTNQSGSLLQGLGGLLGGATNQTATGASTNTAGTNNPVGNLIQGIFGPRKK